MPVCALFTQYSSTKVDLRNILSPPTSSHIFGTDKIGRDIWARILYGGRISIGVGLGSALVAAVLVYRWGLWQVIRAAGLTGSS